MENSIQNRGGELAPGQMLGRYELLMPIAKGGMGNVWAARLKGTRGFRKLVAVKTILRSMENAQLQQMLLDEALLASQIRHPNVVEILELGEHEGTMFLVMELVLGESLLFVLREAQAHGAVPFNIAVNLAAQVCRGLGAAHDLRDENGERVGLIHRDISPANVLVTEQGIVKVVDFGVATTSSTTDSTGEIKGKISYLSPEQLRSEPLDARVDVFATGILLYSLTVGRHPFRCGSESSTISRILSREPAAPPSALVENYPEAVEQVVLKALEKDREARYPSMLALLEALETACPAAFGPRADEAVAQYMHGLMKERSKERAAHLRMAEEWAETSSGHSRTSIAAVATSTAPVAKSSRAVIGVGGVVAGLALAAAGVIAYVNLPVRSEPAATVAAPRPPEKAETPPSLPAPSEPAPAAPEATPVAALAVAPEPPPARAEAPARRKEEAAAKADLTVNAAPLGSAPVEEATAPEPSSAVAATSVPAPMVVPSAPTTGSTPLAPAPAGIPARTEPRVVSSKIAHRQLLTNPSSAAAQIHVPELLKRTEQRFGATVNLCVGTSGRVTQVSIVRSAGPALDPQITQALSTWRYRPLLEAGQPVPFCYVVNYQVDSR